MKTLFVLFSVLFLAACEKSEITPLFPKKSLAEIHGDGKLMSFTLKVPLSKDTLGSYRAAEVLEDESLSREEQGIFRRFWNGLKYRVYNTGINLGISNTIKYSFDYEFSDIDPASFKSVKVKKIFFALENCDEDDEDCLAKRKDKPVTFMFLDRFFMNLSVIQPGDDISFLTDQDPLIKEDEFQAAVSKAYSQERLPFSSYIDERGEVDESVFYDVNLARFENNKAYRKDWEAKKSLEKVLLLRLKKNLRDEEKIHLIRHFKQEKYKEAIKDFSLIGYNIYLELFDEETNPKAYEEFFRVLGSSVRSVDDLGIDSFERCDIKRCANLKTIDNNLVPMLKKSPHIKFDTYLSLKHLEVRDFQYNGFVEIEIKLDPADL